jgi:hypothetical protein
MGMAYSMHERKYNYIPSMVEKPKGNRSLGRLRMNLKKIGLEGVELIHLAQGRGNWRALVNTKMNFSVP